MARDFVHAMSGDINGRYRGQIYGIDPLIRLEGEVPKNYQWSTKYNAYENYKYIWVHRWNVDKSGDKVLRPFSFLKVRQYPERRGPAKKTILKMIDELTQRVLEFEQDEEFHTVNLDYSYARKRRQKKIRGY